MAVHTIQSACAHSPEHQPTHHVNGVEGTLVRPPKVEAVGRAACGRPAEGVGHHGERLIVADAKECLRSGKAHAGDGWENPSELVPLVRLIEGARGVRQERELVQALARLEQKAASNFEQL